MLKQILEVKDVSGTTPDTLEVRCLCDDGKERTVTQHRSAFYGDTAGVDRRFVRGTVTKVNPKSIGKKEQSYVQVEEDVTSEIITFSSQADGDEKRRALMWRLCEEKVMALWLAENPPQPVDITAEFM